MAELTFDMVVSPALGYCLVQKTAVSFGVAETAHPKVIWLPMLIEYAGCGMVTFGRAEIGKKSCYETLWNVHN